MPGDRARPGATAADPGGSRPGGRRRRPRAACGSGAAGPELFDPPLPRRAGQGAPGQQLRNDRGVDGDREVHRRGHGAAVNGGSQLGGRGPQPAVLIEARLPALRPAPPERPEPAAAAAAAARPAREPGRSGSTSPGPPANTHRVPAAGRPGRRPRAPGRGSPRSRRRPRRLASATIRATPRSASSGLPWAVNSTLPGETSPWVKPWPCRYARAWAIGVRTVTVSPGPRLPRPATSCPSDPPGRVVHDQPAGRRPPAPAASRPRQRGPGPDARGPGRRGSGPPAGSPPPLRRRSRAPSPAGSEALQRVLAARRLFGHQPDGGAAAAPQAAADVVAGNLGRRSGRTCVDLP